MAGTVSRKDRMRATWGDPRSFATTLLVLFVDTYGMEALDWDPMTIKLEIQDDLGIILPGPCLDRLMAGIAVLTTDRFRTSLPDFINLCNVLSGDSFDPTEFDPADAAECAWGVTEALLIDPPDEDDESPFSDDIAKYIGEACADEGLIHPPDVLRIGLRADSNRIAERVSYEFSDDPAMMNAVWDMERSKTDDINQTIRTRLRSLVAQLESLPLENGDASDAAARMLQGLNRAASARQ